MCFLRMPCKNNRHNFIKKCIFCIRIRGCILDIVIINCYFSTENKISYVNDELYKELDRIFYITHHYYDMMVFEYKSKKRRGTQSKIRRNSLYDVFT